MRIFIRGRNCNLPHYYGKIDVKLLLPTLLKDYELIDSGDGHKLERYGNNVITRPDSNCVWAKRLSMRFWDNAAVCYHKDALGKYNWILKKTFNKNWLFTYDAPVHEGLCDDPVRFALRLSQSKNIGIFPEQASHWLWFMKLIHQYSEKGEMSVLNLFGYTGAATLCAAAAGASVCHVDASQSAVTWARENQKLSGLETAKIRWIVDDCTKFVTREVRRKARYDAIIMDPPAFGRDPKGKVFEFEKRVYDLLRLCKELSPVPRFFIFNGYSMGYSSIVLKNLLSDFYPQALIDFGELHLQAHKDGCNVPCSLFARFCK